MPVDPPGPRVALQSGFPLRGERSFAALRRGDGVVPIPAVRATIRMLGLLRLPAGTDARLFRRRSSARLRADGAMVRLGDKEAALRLGRGGRPVPLR